MSRSPASAFRFLSAFIVPMFSAWTMFNPPWSATSIMPRWSVSSGTAHPGIAMNHLKLGMPRPMILGISASRAGSEERMFM